MKQVIKESLKRLVADRYLLWLSVFMFILAVIFTVVIALSVHPSELQLVSHYSAFGVTHLYRDQWFYLFVFAAFQLIAASLHIAISTKLLSIKGRSIAVVFAANGIAIQVLGFITALAVINYWIP